MTDKPEIKVLFLDVGGVLLTNGWDRHMRRRAAEKFGLNYEEMDERHHLTFDTFEEGKLGLDEYLRRVVFFERRPFTPEEFKNFMFAQSEPLPEMIAFVRGLKVRFGLRIAAVSNEGKELTIHRVRKFGLASWIDFFIVSAFVHFRKPDHDIYRMALDIAQVGADRVLYIDDRAMFVEVARDLGIRGIHHQSFESTRKALEALGF